MCWVSIRWSLRRLEGWLFKPRLLLAIILVPHDMLSSVVAHPSVSRDNGVCPVGSVFLLRAAPDVAKQSNPSMAVSDTIVARKVGWLVWVHGLLSLFTFCPFVLQLEVPLLLSTPDTIRYSKTPAIFVICKLFPAVWVDICQFQVRLADVLVAELAFQLLHQQVPGHLSILFCNHDNYTQHWF